MARSVILLLVFLSWGNAYSLPNPNSTIEIKTLIGHLSRAMNERFIIDSEVTGTVTILGTLPKKVEQLRSLTEEALQKQGYVLQKRNGTYFVEPHKKSRGQLLRGSNASVVEVLTLHHLTVGEALAALKPLLSKHTYIGGVSKSRNMIVSSSRAHVRRVRELVSKLDVPSRIHKVIPLKNRDAQSIVDTIILPSSLASTATVGVVKNQNSIVINAHPSMVAELESLIALLDSAPKQILLEAIIAEIQEDHARMLGSQWSRILRNKAIGFRPPAGADPSQASAISPGLSLQFGNPASDLFSLFTFLDSDKHSHILSTPSILTEDNQEASLIVGQNIPIITGQYANNNNASQGPFQTIVRHDIGISLKVVPQILADNQLRLNIEQEVSHLGTTTTSVSDVITNKRFFKTTVVATSGQTVILGGLTENNQGSDHSKVPFLGDLPVIGSLFRNLEEDSVKRTLMVFVKPTIIESSHDLPVFDADEVRLP